MALITVTAEQLSRLDLSPVTDWLVQHWHAEAPTITAQQLEQLEKQVQLQIQFPRQEGDPRELSEIPEVRLWFLRLDARYPWFPFCLDWQAGELTRYFAMLIPHEFHRTEGIQFNPEALDLLVMQKVFVLADWLKRYQLPTHSRLQYMAQTFGYELDDSFLDQL